MNTTYYTLTKSGTLEKVDVRVVKINNRWISNPSKEQLASAEIYPRRSTQPPKCAQGYHFESAGWKVVDNEFEQTWNIVEDAPPTYTVQDYDQALEQHLKSVCIARGYTIREPDAYESSSVSRWAQDAKDYIAFRDSVMQYGLEVMNAFNNNEPVPTLDEFKANLPTITWTIE